MKTDNVNPQSIDEYIESFPPAVQTLLQRIRATIQRSVPRATEAIKYRLPTFVLHGNLVHFGAFTHHIGFYAMPSGNVEFQAEIPRWQRLDPVSARSPHSIRADRTDREVSRAGEYRTRGREAVEADTLGTLHRRRFVLSPTHSVKMRSMRSARSRAASTVAALCPGCSEIAQPL